MNILVSQHSVKNISLLIAYISLFPDERNNCRILASHWSCRTLRHMFESVHPVLDNNSPDEVMESTEPMDEIMPGLYASRTRCGGLKKLLDSSFVDYAMCVNPQLFKLMEMSSWAMPFDDKGMNEVVQESAQLGGFVKSLIMQMNN